MVPSMKVTTLTERKKEKVNLHSLMEAFTKVNLNKMRFVVKVSIIGLMVNSIKDSGVKIRCTDKAH